MQVEPDWEIDAFMKASVRHGKRHNIRTDYTLRLLGLEVTASPHIRDAALKPCVWPAICRIPTCPCSPI